MLRPLLALLPALPFTFSDLATGWRRITETVNNILNFQFDDSRNRTAAERAAGVTPTNYAYQPGDIRRYGAKVDGVTDDITAINNAVLSMFSAGGGVVFFPAGTTRISTHILCRSYVTYQGTGWGSIIKATDTSQDNLFGDYGPGYDVNSQQVIIRDLQFDGNRANVSYNTHNGGVSDDAYQNGLRMHRCLDFRIENCFIHDTVFNGISIYNSSSRGIVKNNYLLNIGKSGTPSGAFSYEGIFVEWQEDICIVQDNIIDTCLQDGILVQQAPGTMVHLDISGNIVRNTVINGILVQDNNSSSTGFLEVISIDRNQVINCCTGSTEAAIRVRRNAATYRTYDTTVTNNKVIANNYIGLLVDTGTERSVVTGNICRGNAQKGLIIAGTDCTVDNNISLGNGTDKIDLTSATRPVVGNNIDDYNSANGRYGNFTPTVLTGGADTGRTYSFRYGYYWISAGRLFFQLHVLISAVGTATGTLSIGGLPIAALSTGDYSVCSLMMNNVTFSGIPAALMAQSAQSVGIYNQTSGAGSTNLTNVNLTATSEFYITGSYLI